MKHFFAQNLHVPTYTLQNVLPIWKHKSSCKIMTMPCLMDEIDNNLTHYLVQADQQCHKFNEFLSSPVQHQVHLEHHY